METTSFIDLPNEIIEKHLLVYLSLKDVYSFGMTGNKRFKEVARDVIESRNSKILISTGATNTSCILNLHVTIPD